MAGPKIQFEIVGGFFDRWNAIPVLVANAGAGNFAAFVYQCQLNLDKDGSPTTYGWNNPADKNSLGGPNLQKNLQPLESWNHGAKGITDSVSQFVGLGNACGDPGDGTKGHENFVAKSHNFYWASVVALTKAAARGKVVIDDRPELEALVVDSSGARVTAGNGFFPMVQPDTSRYKGYYVSTTATMTDGTLDDSNTDKWVNAEDVPYAVWANAWKRPNINGKQLALGDFGLAIRNDTGACSGFFYGDAGTPDKVGECSQNLYLALTDSGAPWCTFIAFPGSGPGKVVGSVPEGKIAANVLPLVSKLALTDNPSDLMERIYMGHSMRPSGKKSYQLNDEQGRLYTNIARALNLWGCNFSV